MITRQYPKNDSAAAWVYETGLIKGDDGINLRLNDTLSRAEAAVLIIRARKVADNKVTFADTVSPKILENVYNGLNLFDGKAFNPDDTMTNGAMARAVLRIGNEETNLSYSYLNTSAKFEHAYARDLAAVCNLCLGKDKLTAAFADKKATFGDTVAALVYQFIYKSNSPIMYGTKTEKLPADINDMMNICLTFAKDRGVITLKEDLSAPITVREFIAICILMDDVIGSQTDITTDIHPATSKPVGVDHALLLTETPYGNYRLKLKGMPAAVYSTPAVSQAAAPVKDYNFAREYAGIFTDMLAFMDDSVYKRSGADVRLTYYPSLVWKNKEGGYSMRIRCDVVEMAGTKAFADLFVMGEGATGGDAKLTQGSTVWFDVATGQSATSIFITDEKAYVEQVVSLS